MPLRISPDNDVHQALLEAHESGMGYQQVDDGRAVVFNAEIMCNLEDGSLSDHDGEWLAEFLFDHNAQPAMLQALNECGGPLEVVTHGSYVSSTRSGEVLERYSAFLPDRRILPDGSVRQGTYVTTATDATLVPSGLAAVSRYALPNPAPAIYRYTLTAPPGTNIRCGTCKPLFGQAGGGVEITLGGPLAAGAAALPPQTIPER